MEYYNQYYEGIFWSQDFEESKIIATLYINEIGHATISSLTPLLSKGENKVKQDEWDILSVAFGYIIPYKGKDAFSIKLYDLYKDTAVIGGFDKYQYTSRNALISKNKDGNITNLLYNTVMMSSDVISNWVSVTGFKFNTPVGDTFELNQFYKQPKPTILFKNKNSQVYFYYRASAGLPYNRESKITESVYINYELDKEYNIKDAYHHKVIIERLFNLIIFKPFTMQNIEFKGSSKNGFKVLKKNKGVLDQLDHKLKFDFFIDNSQQIFTKWFEKYDSLELIIKNFFSVYGQKGVLEENKFLTYISIIERYHSSNFNKKETVDVVKKYNQELYLSIDGEEVIGLKERLLFVLDRSNIKEVIPNIPKYAKCLKVTRNYHAHLEEKHKERSLDNNGIIQANYILEQVIRELLLIEIGIEQSKIRMPADANPILCKYTTTE